MRAEWLSKACFVIMSSFLFFFELKESSGDLGIRGSNEIRLQSKLFDCDVHTKKNNRDSPVPSSLSIYALHIRPAYTPENVLRS